MPKVKLTKTLIDSLEYSDKSVFYQDTQVNGLAVRINKTGKVFMINKRVNGDLKRIVIGDCSFVTLYQAREKAIGILADLVAGINPVAEKVKIPTLAEAYEHYKNEKDLKLGTIKTYDRQILKKLSKWLDTPLNDIMQSDVSTKFLEISKKSPSQANATMRAFSAVWNHARLSYLNKKEEKIIKPCPVEILDAKNLWHDIKPRTRHLDEDVLGKYVKTLVDFKSEDYHLMMPHSNNARDLLILYICTGIRLEEGYSLPWSNVDLEHGTMTLDNTKNSDDLHIALGDVLVAMLRHRAKFANGSHWVFPSRVVKCDGHVTDISKQYDNIAELAGVKITPHDLRRTFSTVANILGLNVITIKKLLNHRRSKSSDDVTLQYIQVSKKQMRKTMNEIEAFIFNESGMTQNEVIEKIFKD